MDNKLRHRFDAKRTLDTPPGLSRRASDIKLNGSVIEELPKDNINMSPTTAFNQTLPSHDIHDIDKSR